MHMYTNTYSNVSAAQSVASVSSLEHGSQPSELSG